MSRNALFAKPHRRLNALTGEWVLVSPQRTQRPWLGRQEEPAPEERPAYDPDCYLCPGNARAGGGRNPLYSSTFVFGNDFPALMPDTPPNDWQVKNLLAARAERGVCRVVCFSPRHDLTLSRMAVPMIREVVDVWAGQSEELGQTAGISYVQVFENNGAAMGASNPHPHGQIWANESIPVEPAKELRGCGKYLHDEGSCLLCDYLELEMKEGERLVCANVHFVAVVPFWAVWPFETLLLSRRHVNALADLSFEERDALADVLKRLTTRYDNLLQTPFPYSMGFHQRPTDNRAYPQVHLHAHFYPPLLRSATVRKFLVGYEMLAQPQRDVAAENAAERLRTQSERHYTERMGQAKPES